MVYFSAGKFACPVCASDMFMMFDTPLGPMVWLHPGSSGGPCPGIYRYARPVPEEPGTGDSTSERSPEPPASDQA